MTISMYQAAVPVFIRYLNNLAHILKKGEAFAEARGIDPEVLFNCRLAPDMLPLSRQIHIATDVARRCIARLVDDELVSIDDNEKSFSEFYERINNTVEYIKSIKPEQIDGTEDKAISLIISGDTFKFEGKNFLLYFSLPNVYFHVTTAYNILRHNGVELGKVDFLGDMPV